MKLSYKKKHIRHHLILGIAWLIIGLLGLLTNANQLFFYGFILLGVLNLVTYFFKKERKYLSIENGIIYKHQLVSKKISLDKIKRIKNKYGMD